MTPAAYAPLAAAAITIALIAWMLRGGARLPLDIPNERSLHQRPVPRSGGIAIMAGTLAGLAMLQTPLSVVVPAALLAAVSHFDDLRGLPVFARFAAHLAAAAGFTALAFAGLSLPFLCLIVVGIVWSANLYNFMDGSDGLAGGMTLLGFSFLGAGAWNSGDDALMLASLVVAASAVGFLAFNFPPARIFMGDAGSVPLGFLAAAFSLAGWRDGDWPFWFPALVFAPFIVDATLTLAKRTLRGERFWLAHKTHYYQRLVQMGWSHRRTALAEYALMILSGFTALWALGQAPYLQFAAVVCIAVLYGVAIASIDLAWNRRRKNNIALEP